MKVVLMKDVEKVGKKGEVVDVPRGHGVNYLVPQGLAMVATDDAMRQAERASEQKKERDDGRLTLMKKVIRTVDGKKLQVKAKANKLGRLYGSMDKESLEKAMAESLGISGTEITLKTNLAQPIRETGKYSLDVEISGGGQSKKVEAVVSVIAE